MRRGQEFNQNYNPIADAHPEISNDVIYRGRGSIPRCDGAVQHQKRGGAGAG